MNSAKDTQVILKRRFPATVSDGNAYEVHVYAEIPPVEGLDQVAPMEKISSLRTVRISIVLSCALQMASAIADQPSAVVDTPPAARTVDVVDHEFGITLPDPYRWMEGENNEEFQTWLKAQGEYTRRKLDALPTLSAWQERLTKVTRSAVIRYNHKRAGERIFFQQLAGKSTSVLVVREKDGSQRTLFAPATVDDQKGAASITQYAPSPDGRLVAINVDSGGSEITHVRVMDVATGKWLTDGVEPVWGEFAARWLPDGRGFMYTQMAPEKDRVGNDPLQGMRTRMHVLGVKASDDPTFLRAGEGAGSNPSFTLSASEFPEIEFDAASMWAIATAGGARPEVRFSVAARSDAFKPQAKWRSIAEYSDQIESAGLHGDTLYLLSKHDHPNGRILAIDLSKRDATLKNAREVVAETDVVLTELGAARDAIYVKRMSRGVDSFLRVDYATGNAISIEMPFAGTAIPFDANTLRDGFLVGLRGWTLPRVTYIYDAGVLRDIKLGCIAPADYGDLATIETEAISADGTAVPLSVIYRKDTKLDGRNRAIIVGYGGYGISIQPFFDTNQLAWVETGAVLAVAHVRGGGEKGDLWHRAGQGANKHKGVEDFIACAEQLTKLGYATPDRIALNAGSMGGTLVGGAITHVPEKFAAAVVEVGILNPVRLLVGKNGANQIAELGDPRTVEGMKALAEMDPYQAIKQGTKYPAVLLEVGLNDNRVPPWETCKFGAQLRTATASAKPILIRTDAAQGHGVNSLDAAVANAADTYAFLEAFLPGR